MTLGYSDTTVLIPSLEPDARLVPYLKELLKLESIV